MGLKRIYWKMSIDLSHPQVASMGQHDALDGLITYLQLSTSANDTSILSNEIADMVQMCASKTDGWVTSDPLGIGGLLMDACRLLQVRIETTGTFQNINLSELLEAVLRSAEKSLDSFMRREMWVLKGPAESRLAFRELGLSIGLKGVSRMLTLLEERPIEQPAELSTKALLLTIQAKYSNLAKEIEDFWLKPRSKECYTWSEHEDINSVMLATSLLPSGFLEVRFEQCRASRSQD